jgi:hypothetical protein
MENKNKHVFFYEIIIHRIAGNLSFCYLCDIIMISFFYSNNAAEKTKNGPRFQRLPESVINYNACKNATIVHTVWNDCLNLNVFSPAIFYILSITGGWYFFFNVLTTCYFSGNESEQKLKSDTVSRPRETDHFLWAPLE